MVNPDQPSLSEATQNLAKLDIEALLLPVLVQLVIIISVARLFGILARRVGQPNAVGEILAGLLLGPSLFGWLFPVLSAAIFQPELHGIPQELANAAFPKVFMVLAQLGLIFLLFQIGLEFEFSHLQQHGRSAFLISLMGIVAPMALGIGFAFLIHGSLEDGPRGGPVPILGLSLFLGVAMSITAIPILGRMMIELGMNRTRLGAITITAAAIDDATGWILLATVQAIVRSEFDVMKTLLMIGETVGFATMVFFGMRPVLVRYFRWCLPDDQSELGVTPLAVILIVLILCALATNLIGIFAIFGAFMLGAALSDQVRFREAVTRKIRDLVTAFFLPIFFTYTGLRTTVQSVQGWEHWLICLGIMVIAFAGKWGGCYLAARFSGFSRSESNIIGIMMNTRALMELIVINIGYELGVIPKSLFCMLVLMALLSTVVTTPILLAFRKGTEIEEPIAQSGFLSSRPHEASVPASRT